MITQYINHSQLPSVICALIDQAKSTIDLYIYQATVPKNQRAEPTNAILAALKRALSRGVKVRALIQAYIEGDRRGRDNNAYAAILRDAGAKCYVYNGKGIMHGKTIITDGRAAIFTTANLTAAAFTANVENSVLVTGATVPLAALHDFNNHLAQATLQQGQEISP